MLRGLSYTAASFLIFFARARQAGSGTMAGPVTCGCDWVRCGRVGLRRTARSTAPLHLSVAFRSANRAARATAPQRLAV